MNAIEFVKEYGIEEAKKAIKNVAWCETAYCMRLKHGCFKTNSDCCIDINDLKQIVDAFELVDSYGGLKGAKNWIKNVVSNESMSNIMAINSDLSKAINLVEQCQ